MMPQHLAFIQPVLPFFPDYDQGKCVEFAVGQESLGTVLAFQVGNVRKLSSCVCCHCAAAIR